MPLFYKSNQSTLPSRDGKKKWYPRLVKVGKIVDTQKLGELIAEKSSLTPGDVHNTVRNLMAVMREQLLNSRSVKLDGLGTFTVIAKAGGNGVDAADEVSATQIARLRIQFTPASTRPAGGGTTRAMFAEVEYERWEGANSQGSNSGQDDDDENEDDPTA